MDKQGFFAELKKGLAGLPQDYSEKTTQYYSEMIDDRVEDGLTEAEAIAAIGPVDEIVRQAVADIPLQSLVKNKITPDRKLRGWEIALLILGFPLWFPLLIAAGAVLLSFYIVIWALVVSLFAVVLSLLLSGLALLFVWIPNTSTLGLGGILCFIGCGLLLIGISVLLFFAAMAAANGTVKLAKTIAFGLKKRFMRKEIEK